MVEKQVITYFIQRAYEICDMWEVDEGVTERVQKQFLENFFLPEHLAWTDIYPRLQRLAYSHIGSLASRHLYLHKRSDQRISYNEMALMSVIKFDAQTPLPCSYLVRELFSAAFRANTVNLYDSYLLHGVSIKLQEYIDGTLTVKEGAIVLTSD